MTDRAAHQSGGQNDDLQQLVEAYLNGMLAPDGLTRLDERLQSDPAARQIYRDQVQMHAFLTWRVRGVSERDVIERTTTLEEDSVPQRALRGVASATRWFRRPIGLATAAVPLIILAGWLALWSSRGDEVARLTRSVGAQWNDGAMADGDSLWAGQQLKLQAGVAEITYANGAIVILQGPATFQLETTDKGRLDAGILTANVPEQARGFSIDTPSTTIVDLGTEFGIVVKPERATSHIPNPKSQISSTEVHVFQGVVELAPPKKPKNKPAVQVAKLTVEKLTAGNAVEVDQHQQTRQLPAARPEEFIRELASARTVKVDLGGRFGNLSRDGETQVGWIGVNTPNLSKPDPLTVGCDFAARGSAVTIRVGTGDRETVESRSRANMDHPLADVLEDFYFHRGKAPLRIKLSNLAAGKYRLTSYHHEPFLAGRNVTPTTTRISASVEGAASFDLSGATDVVATFGPQVDTPGTGVLTFVADGQHDVTIRYSAVAGPQVMLNGFILEALGRSKTDP
jgi:hypothetical protein